MDSSLIITERRGSIEIIRLNRSEKFNALTREMILALSDTFTNLESDADLRALILTGAGDHAFCAGTDINELTQLKEEEAVKVSERGQALCNQIENAAVPVIAAVNGIAAGGGCELALACHIRIASNNARFSLPESKLGIIPGYRGTRRLAREIGSGRAWEMMLTGKTVGAEEALQMGLVNRLTTSDDLLTAAESLAGEIALLAPLAIRACLKAITLGVDLSLAEGLALEAGLFASLFATEDMREGTRAFLEKRAPVFKGA
ncbi:MAG: enoyl-CoA hydratase/isomerase family protein [Pyrinomonadaceae bacterium]|nr:enoyl-CoA hydratase/isomerase family protein [Pyrinomonadaceae bacterium]